VPTLPTLLTPLTHLIHSARSAHSTQSGHETLLTLLCSLTLPPTSRSQIISADTLAWDAAKEYVNEGGGEEAKKGGGEVKEGGEDDGDSTFDRWSDTSMFDIANRLRAENPDAFTAKLNHKERRKIDMALNKKAKLERAAEKRELAESKKKSKSPAKRKSSEKKQGANAKESQKQQPKKKAKRDEGDEGSMGDDDEPADKPDSVEAGVEERKEAAQEMTNQDSAFIAVGQGKDVIGGIKSDSQIKNLSRYDNKVIVAKVSTVDTTLPFSRGDYDKMMVVAEKADAELKRLRKEPQHVEFMRDLFNYVEVVPGKTLIPDINPACDKLLIEGKVP
jgi:hypothetical protein